jgi:hypothetical protein
MTAPVTRVEWVVRFAFGGQYRYGISERAAREAYANALSVGSNVKLIERTTTITERVLAPEEEG